MPGSPEARRTHDSLPSVVNNPLIQNLKAENAKLQSQYADLSKRYTEKHPILTSLKSNMAALQAQIQGETDKIVQSLKAELSGQLKGNNVRIVDPAKVPERPFKPIVGKNLLLGFLLGCLLAFFTALLVETLDQSMRTQDDVERKLGQPFLGTIPHAQQKAGERVFQTLQVKESSLTSESIRNLRTMVDFAGVSQRARQILVTSTIQSEGKTYIAGNLAVAFSQLGENVLLIDGDMRRPKIHRDFRVANAKGLSDFLLSGKDMEEAESLFQEIPGLPRLKLLVCGTRPPNPSELLNTPKVGALIAWAKSRFDRIVVDCTPMFPIHDTLLWGRHIPSVIFVVRYGKTRTQLIRKALQRLQSGAMKPLGVVINAARAGSLAYAAYGYYYQQYYHSYETEAPKASSGK
jgi:capsular exopolysaccharide synthesis family protein